MDFNALLVSLTDYLGLGAAGAILLFGVGVALDNVAGVLLAKIKGHDENGVPEKFELDKLGSFLGSQFGTKKAAIVAGAVASTVLTAVAAQILAGSTSAVMVQAAEAVALATATAGAVAQFASVAEDLVAKARALFAR
jgi:hypothetical protein